MFIDENSANIGVYTGEKRKRLQKVYKRPKKGILSLTVRPIFRHLVVGTTNYEKNMKIKWKQ